MQSVAVVDIGTNSILYLLARADAKRRVVTLHQENASVRLGRFLAQMGTIFVDALPDALRVLNDYKCLAHRHGAAKLITVGTHLFRTAVNAGHICSVLKEKTGLEIEVLTEKAEAAWSFHGAVYDRDIQEECVVVDIGGGSTELIRGRPDGITESESFDLGAVVLSETHLSDVPPRGNALSRVSETILSELDRSRVLSHGRDQRLVGVGGTITTLAALDLSLDEYDPNRVDGYILSRRAVQSRMAQFQDIDHNRIKHLLPFAPERADIILAGTSILHEIMNTGRFRELLVSDRGLRFGIALREFSFRT